MSPQRSSDPVESTADSNRLSLGVLAEGVDRISPQRVDSPAAN
jgi:hypothetical protein